MTTARTLRQQLTRLSRENRDLRNEINFLRTHPRLASGLRGETLIARIVRGHLSRTGAPYDVIARNGTSLEIKFSSLLTIRDKTTRRWAWTKIYGELGNKRFKRLVLVGEADPRFSHLYKDPRAPYILFDVPYREAIRLTGGVRPGRRSIIHLTTNPTVIRSTRAWILYRRFETTIGELERRYWSSDKQSNVDHNLTFRSRADRPQAAGR